MKRPTCNNTGHVTKREKISHVSILSLSAVNVVIPDSMVLGPNKAEYTVPPKIFHSEGPSLKSISHFVQRLNYWNKC